MKTKILLGAFLFAVVDVATTSVLLAHGNNWEHFILKLRDRNIATTGFDLMLLTLIRAGFLLGCVFGILRNPAGGPKRVSSLLNLVFTVLVLDALFLATKLLIYSETEEFRVGSTETIWFWSNFAWTFFALICYYLLFSKLGAQKASEPAKVEINADGIASGSDENTPLLGNNVNHEAVSINASGRRENVANESSSESDSSDESEDGEDSNKKKKKKKSFKDLVNKVTIRKMLSYSKQDAWMICLAIVFLLGAALAEVFIPLFTGRVISGIAIEQDTTKFTKNIMIMALITIAASVCAGCRGGIMKVVISRFNMRIRNTLFSSLTKQEIGFFDSHKTGDMLSRLTSDTSTMSDMIGLNCNIFLRSLVKAVGTCVFMFSLSWRLSIITFMGLPIVVVVSKLYGNYYKKLQTQVQDAYASANEVAEEVCSSMRTVRSFANENGERERYSEKMMSVYKVQLKQALAYAGYMWSSEFFELLLYVVVLWYGGHLVTIGLLNAEIFISMMFYMEELSQSFEEFGDVYTGSTCSTLSNIPVNSQCLPTLKGELTLNLILFSLNGISASTGLNGVYYV